MDNKRKIILKILKAFCDDKRKPMTDELIGLWHVALEDFSDEVIGFAFKSIARNRSKSIGFDVTYDEFVEACKSVRKHKQVNREYNKNQIDFEPLKQLEDLSAESKSNEDITPKEYKELIGLIAKNRTVENTFQPTLSISEEVDLEGNIVGYVCHGYADDITFTQECLNQFGVDIKSVKRTVAKTMAIADGQKIWLTSKITVGYL
jgi:hypothetical protein